MALIVMRTISVCYCKALTRKCARLAFDGFTMRKDGLQLRHQTLDHFSSAQFGEIVNIQIERMNDRV